IQYPDYVIWRNNQAQEGMDRALAYWKSKLRGYQAFKVDPDFSNTPERAVNSKIVSKLLPRNITDALKAFSNQQSGTKFSTTLAACLALLYRHTGKTDLAIGSPLA